MSVLVFLFVKIRPTPRGDRSFRQGRIVIRLGNLPAGIRDAPRRPAPGRGILPALTDGKCGLPIRMTRPDANPCLPAIILPTCTRLSWSANGGRNRSVPGPPAPFPCPGLIRRSLKCGWRDSNPHASRHQILSLARLPISPHPQKNWPSNTDEVFLLCRPKYKQLFPKSLSDGAFCLGGSLVSKPRRALF